VKTHILDEHENEVIGELSCATSDDASSSDQNCRLCRLKNRPEVVVVTCEIDVKPEETFLWTQQVSFDTV